MLLILSGNPNLATIRSVVYFANEHYGCKIRQILFLDTKQTLISPSGNLIEHERNQIIREYFDRKNQTVSIRSDDITEEPLHIRIPAIISEQLKIFSADDLIIDITNGTKFISNILYAAASFSRIQNLFFVSVAKERQAESPENLTKDDYNIDVFSPVKDVDSIAEQIY